MEEVTSIMVEMVRKSGLLDPQVFRPAEKFSGASNTISLELLYLGNKKNWTAQASALFDGAYYLAKNGDVKASGMNPMLHYIKHGFKEGRSASPYVDVDHIVQQLLAENGQEHHEDMKEVRPKVLSRFSGIRELLATTGCDPSPFFSNEWYVQRNEHLKVVDDALPLQDYVRRSGRAPQQGRFLECTPLASMNYYMAKNPDLLKAGVIPLRHLLTHGLAEGRKFGHVSVVSQEFMQNSSELYADPGMKALKGILNPKDGQSRLPGPFWPTPFARRRIPALAHVAKTGSRSAFVGVVLYKNSDLEIRRLYESVRNEVAGSEGYDIRYRFIANDGMVERYRALLGDSVIDSPGSENIGFGKAHNLMMRECFDEDRLYIGANPDGYFIPGCIKSLVDFNDFYAGRALIEASAMPIDHPKWHDPIALDTQWVSGACFALSRALWLKVGGFDEKIHLYCEDVDLSWRVRLFGGFLKVCPNARFMHDVTPRVNKLETEAEDRRRSMLQGAYYLSRKWGNSKKASLYEKELTQELSPEELAAVVEPDVEFDKDMVEHVADFSHPRFAPSRFWK